MDMKALRAEIDAAKVVAMANFKRDWGTDNIRDVMGAIAKVAAQSTSPADCAVKARAALTA